MPTTISKLTTTPVLNGVNSIKNASQWAIDMQPQLQTDPYASLSNLPLQERCLYGGFKNLFSGVTTVAHHNALYRFLKKHFFLGTS